MNELKYFIFVIFILFSLDQMALYLERKGYLYWRKKNGQSDGTGNALLELNALLNPSTKFVIEEKEKPHQQQQNIDSN
jgi:hypothetical protein